MNATATRVNLLDVMAKQFARHFIEAATVPHPISLSSRRGTSNGAGPKDNDGVDDGAYAEDAKDERKQD